MSFEINKVHLSDNRWGMSHIPAKSVQLIISDPPYYKVKGDFDFTFKDFDDYLKFMEDQAIAYKRVLADNGSLFVYGHAKKIAYVQCIFDKYFNLENNICWQVPDRRTNKGIDGYRSFAPVTERILFYSNEMVSTNGEYVYPARDYLRAEIKRAVGFINYRVINEVFGTATNGGGMAKDLLTKGQESGWIYKPPMQFIETNGPDITIVAVFEEYTHPLESQANKQIEELATAIMQLYPEWIGVQVPGGAEIEGGEGAIDCAIRLLTRKKDEGFNFVKWLIDVEKAMNKEQSQFNFDEETLRTMYAHDFLIGTTPEKMAEWEENAKQSEMHEWQMELIEELKKRGRALDMSQSFTLSALFEGGTPAADAASRLIADNKTVELTD